MGALERTLLSGERRTLSRSTGEHLLPEERDTLIAGGRKDRLELKGRFPASARKKKRRQGKIGFVYSK